MDSPTTDQGKATIFDFECRIRTKSIPTKLATKVKTAQALQLISFIKVIYLGNQELNSSPQPSTLKDLHSCYEDRQSGTVTDCTSGRNKGRFSNNNCVYGGVV